MVFKDRERGYRRGYGEKKGICADQIYSSRSNLTLYQPNAIHLSGPRLGLPKMI